MPVTTLLVEPIVAIDVLLLLHVPPVVPSLSVVVVPAHIENTPNITEGTLVTVTFVVARQPVDVIL